MGGIAFHVGQSMSFVAVAAIQAGLGTAAGWWVVRDRRASSPPVAPLLVPLLVALGVWGMLALFHSTMEEPALLLAGRFIPLVSLVGTYISVRRSPLRASRRRVVAAVAVQHLVAFGLPILVGLIWVARLRG